jgi:2,5-diketo-D-gluconate reductase B
MAADLPPIGLGTWQNTAPEQCAESVRAALEMGYRHVDTAQFYGNEESVGEGIAAADVPREDVFVATKVHPEAMGLAHDEVIAGAETSLDRLGLEYLDLLYVHWPVGNYEAGETLPAFDELLDRGLIGNVGVSNFSSDLLAEAREVVESPLFANQVEMHPLLPQPDLLTDAREHGYHLVAYSPLARGNVFDVPEIQAVAAKHDASPAQVSLAWLLRKDGVRAIPKATSEAHVRDNLAALDLDLDPEDVARIDGIERRERYVERAGSPWLS